MTSKNLSKIASNNRMLCSIRDALACFLCLLFLIGPGVRATVVVVQTQDIEALSPGRTIERDLAASHSHSYRISLSSGEYLHISVAEKGIDVTLKLFGPDSKLAVSLNTSNGTRGSESVQWLAKEAGSYRLEVNAAMAEAQSGRYEVNLVELRSATEQDQNRVAAQVAFAEAEGLAEQAAKVSQESASKKYEEALSFFKGTADRAAESMALQRLGKLYLGLAQFPKALEYFNQSLQLARANGDKRGEGFALKGIGDVLEALSEPQKALENLNQALALFQALGDTAAEAHTLGSIGIMHRALGQRQKALEYYDRALPLLRAAGDKVGAARMLQNIAVVYKVMQEYQKSLEYLYQALGASRVIKDQTLEAITLTNIGHIFLILGEPQKGIDYGRQALPLWRLVGNKRGEALVLSNLGDAHKKLGEWQKAMDYYSEELPIDREIGDKYGEAYAIMSMGKVYDKLGDEQKALEHFNRALPVMHAMGDKDGEGAILQSLGEIHRRRGDLQKALGYYNQGLALARADGTPLAEAGSLSEIAAIERDQGKLNEALATMEKAIAPLDRVRAAAGGQENRASLLAAWPDYRAFQIDLLMRKHAAEPQAGHDLAALSVSEQGRARSLLELLAESHTDIRQGVDAQLLEHERSLKERLTAKLDALAKLLQGKYTDEQKGGLEREIASLTDEYRVSQAEIRERSPRFAALTQPQSLGAKEIRQQLLDDNTVLLEYSLGREHSYLWVVTPDRVQSYQLPPKAEIEAQARHVYELLIARQSKPRLTDAQQRTRVMETDARYVTQAATLSQMLLGPVAAQLGTKRLLVVTDGALQYIPFAALPKPTQSRIAEFGSRPEEQHPNIQSTLPKSNQFAIRRAQSVTPLIAEHEIVSLPSASVLAVLRREMAGREPAAKTIAVLADPVFEPTDARVKLSLAARKNPGSAQPLSTANSLSAVVSLTPLERAVKSVRGVDGRAGLRRLLFSRDEAEAIISVTPQPLSLRALDFRANRKLAMSDELSRYRIIHFATHGLLDSQNPELSGLVLSLVDEAGQPQDGFLRLHEIYNLRLNADLVVLSACQTGLGKEIRGEGLVGLTRGFMFAGAPRVMASLWQVDDAATTELMKRFYRGMMQEKLTPAASLRMAQLELLKKKEWQSPYYWGAFVLQGEWK